MTPMKFSFSSKIGSAPMIEMEELDDWDKYLTSEIPIVL